MDQCRILLPLLHPQNQRDVWQPCELGIVEFVSTSAFVAVHDSEWRHPRTHCAMISEHDNTSI